jgi:hypothetical protein
VSLGFFALILGLCTYLMFRQQQYLNFLPKGVTLDIKVPHLCQIISRNLPSFLHTFSFIMITLGIHSHYMVYIGWLTIELVFEIGQYPVMASWIAKICPLSLHGNIICERILSFFINGRFDPLDLAATCLGALTAFCLAESIYRRSKQ